MELTKKELRAMARMIKDFARDRNTDTAGIILKSGAYIELDKGMEALFPHKQEEMIKANNDAISTLASKIDTLFSRS